MAKRDKIGRFAENEATEKRRARVKELRALGLYPRDITRQLIAEGFSVPRHRPDGETPETADEYFERFFAVVRQDSVRLGKSDPEYGKPADLVAATWHYLLQQQEIYDTARDHVKTTAVTVTHKRGISKDGPIDQTDTKTERRINFQALQVMNEAAKNIARVRGVLVDGLKEGAEPPGEHTPKGILVEGMADGDDTGDARNAN
jgi:hypothetical protein